MLAMKSNVTNQIVKNRVMEHSKRFNSKSEALHIDPASRGESSYSSIHRSHSSGHEPFAPSPGSSIGASVSMFSSRNSEAEIGDSDELDGVRTIMMNIGVADMLADKEIQTRYPEFFQFLVSDQPTWFEPASLNGTVYRVHQTTPLPENHRKLRREMPYEMLDLMYRFFRQKHVNAQRKRENKELLDANKQLRIAAVQMFTKAEQEEEYISNSLLKKIQQLNQDKDYLVKKYQRDEESLTKSLMANVAKIPDVHGDEAERLMADKQAEIERLRAYCSRAEKNYQEELMRLRAEKVDHESALEQEQELLINTLGKRMSQMNEEKRKMQQTLEMAYVNGFVDYDETVENALHASTAQRCNNTVSTPLAKAIEQPQSSTTPRQQVNENVYLQIENKKLVGMCNQEKRRSETTQAEIKKLNARMAKMEAALDSIRNEALRGDGFRSPAWRSALVGHENSADEHPTRLIAERRAHGSSPPTNVVMPSTSRTGASSSMASSSMANNSMVNNSMVNNSMANSTHEHPLAQVAPILATVFPTQRAAPMRNERAEQPQQLHQAPQNQNQNQHQNQN